MRLFERKTYRHLNVVTVSSAAVAYNHAALEKLHPNVQICPVLKSNAYGHGLSQVAPIFDSLHPEFLIVDSLYEAYVLYKRKVKTPILIMGYTAPENFTVKHLPFHVAIFDLETARTLNKHQRGCNVHIFIDTGMHREGVCLEELPSFLDALSSMKNLNIVGLCSHFADADNPKDDTFLKKQIEVYKHAYAFLKERGIDPKWRHISASGGTYKVFDPVFTMIRAGIAEYGISPLEKKDKADKRLRLHPALQFETTLAQIKTIHPGEKVGYSCTYTAKTSRRIGLLPAGYYDGVDRRLSNCGYVKIRDTFCPIIGRISMNMTSIDISKVNHPKVGEKVIIYSRNPKDKNSISHAAQTAKTIPYDLLVRIAESVQRRVL